MTKEELEKATGQELIDERNYCGVDGYYGDYLDDVNAEMLKRFNRLAELEKACEETQELLDKQIEATYRLDKENAELKEKLKPENCLKLLAKEGYIKFTSDQLTKAKELLKNLLSAYTSYADSFDDRDNEIVTEAEQFIKDSEVEK